MGNRFRQSTYPIDMEEIRMYKAENQMERKLPEPGTRVKGRVAQVFDGKLGEFLSKEVLEKWDNANPDHLAIKVVVECEDGVERSKVIQYNADNSVHPKSSMAAWKRNYGEYPKSGQEVYLTYNAEGYANFPK